MRGEGRVAGTKLLSKSFESPGKTACKPVRSEGWRSWTVRTREWERRSSASLQLRAGRQGHSL